MAKKVSLKRDPRPMAAIILVLIIFFTLVMVRVQNTQDKTSVPIEAASTEQLITQIEAEKGILTRPFQQKDGYIYQIISNSNSISGGGVATYQFVAPQDGIYTLRGLIKTINDGRNSFYVDIDKTPTYPEDIWDTPVFSDFTWKRVSARGNGTFDKSQYAPKYYSLKAGKHQIIIVGREANTLLDKIQIHLQPSSSTPGPTSTLIPVGTNLIPNGDFETGDLCCSYSTTIVKNPARQGNYAVRFELNATDPIVEGSKRTEITSYDTEFNKDYWYRFSVYLPNDWQYDTSREIIDQWHNHPDAGEDYRSPALSLRIDGKNWGLRSVWDSKKITEIEKYEGSLFIDLGPYQTGVWTDWTVHARWSYSGTNGYLEVFKNGTSVYKRTGPNTYNDPTGPYFKFGIYKFDWLTKKTLTTKRILYQDNVSIIKGN